MLHGNDVLHHLTHDFERAFEVEAFEWPPRSLLGNVVRVFRLRTDKCVPLGRYWRIRALILPSTFAIHGKPMAYLRLVLNH
jgi:isoprenylcysteine carboxyl methyltransferase (ICMT) family protein YpbQ